MPGIDQLPSGSEGAAALSLTYACISLICSCTLLWLTIAHRERWSYITLLAGSTGISTIASISQQIHDIILYEDIVKEQFRRRNTVFHNPELAIANASFGVDLVLYYIQYYLYNVQALLVMFWAGELAQSVYGFGVNTRAREIIRRLNLAGKAASFLVPLTTILMLRSPAIQRNYIGFILVADLPLMISLAIGSGLMCTILARYLGTKKKITNWSFNNQHSRDQSEAVSGASGSVLYSSATGKSRNNTSEKKSFYDRWLMVRFFVSFVILACFEVTNALFQFQSVRNLKKDASLSEPDLSAQRARTTFFLFLPGTTAGIFLFIVFGTTSSCRSKICEIFIPRRWRKYEPSTGWKLTRGENDLPSIRGDAKSVPREIHSQDVRSIVSQDDGDVELGAVLKSSVGHRNNLMKPLPIVPLARVSISRFTSTRSHPPNNHSFSYSLDGSGRSRSGSTNTRGNFQSRNSFQVSHMEETHHGGRPDDSDDALPILPIMPTRTD